jgi:hypothetical protein
MRRLNYVIKNDGIRVSYRDSVSKGRDRIYQLIESYYLVAEQYFSIRID